MFNRLKKSSFCKFIGDRQSLCRERQEIRVIRYRSANCPVCAASAKGQLWVQRKLDSLRYFGQMIIDYQSPNNLQKEKVFGGVITANTAIPFSSSLIRFGMTHDVRSA